MSDNSSAKTTPYSTDSANVNKPYPINATKPKKKAAGNQLGESELGQYLDRLLAQSLVAIAQQYQAGSIVVPQLSNLRESIQSEIQAKAEHKCPGYLEGQKKYAKQYRINVHH